MKTMQIAESRESVTIGAVPPKYLTNLRIVLHHIDNDACTTNKELDLMIEDKTK